MDHATGAGYVRYSAHEVAGTREIWRDGTVAADIDRDGGIVGIEVLNFKAATIEHARAYATSQDLYFPTEAYAAAGA